MGRLEPGFSRLRWPPLVKSITDVPYYPGYRYEFFRTFSELEEYFTAECGADWKKQEWYIFWRGQHLETQHDDRVEERLSGTTSRIKNGGPRKDRAQIYQLCLSMYQENPKISSYALARQLIRNHDITISHVAIWTILKKLRAHDSTQD